MTSDRARIIAPPPLIGLTCILLAFLAHHFKPLPIFQTRSAFQIAAGILLIVIAIAIVASARSIFAAHGTHLNPYRPTEAIVTTGVYRFTRNPIYIAFLLVLPAVGLFANSFWFLIFTVLLGFILHFGVVKREETYLEDKFGDAYRDYCRRVRRWI